MFGREKFSVVVCVLYLVSCTLYLSSISFAQDEQIIERYKLMLSRNPKEGSTFDRLYQFYLEGTGLDAMVTDYQDGGRSQTRRFKHPTHLGTHLQTSRKGP